MIFVFQELTDRLIGKPIREEIVEATPPVPDIPESPAPAPSTTEPITSVIEENIRFDVVKVELNGNKKLIVELRATNLADKDRSISLRYQSRLYDNVGNEISLK